MRIVLRPDTLPQLEAPEDLRRFSIALDTRLQDNAAAALAPVGVPTDETASHAWVRPDAVRALSPLAGDPEWQKGFDGMLAFAESKGFAGPGGAIRAHVEVLPAQETVSAEDFRLAMRKFASGVCVVAAGDGEDRRGMTVSAFSSVSAEPPMVLVCLNRDASAHDALLSAASYSINILGAQHEEVAMLFAGARGVRGADRFGQDDWRQAPQGAPVLVGAHQSLVCEPVSAQQAGTHTVLIGRVVATGATQDEGALVNYDGAFKPTTQVAAA